MGGHAGRRRHADQREPRRWRVDARGERGSRGLQGSVTHLHRIQRGELSAPVHDLERHRYGRDQGAGDERGARARAAEGGASEATPDLGDDRLAPRSTTLVRSSKPGGGTTSGAIPFGFLRAAWWK